MQKCSVIEQQELCFDGDGKSQTKKVRGSKFVVELRQLVGYRQPEGECVELRRCWQDKENRLKAETMRERVESRLKYMVIIEAARAAEIR